MHISDEQLAEVRSQGFTVVEGFLDDDEIKRARAGFFADYPTHDEYFADPARYTKLTEHQFAGLSSWASTAAPRTTARTTTATTRTTTSLSPVRTGAGPR